VSTLAWCGLHRDSRMSKRKYGFCSNENHREENYLSYLYFKFYFVAGYVDSLSKYGVHLVRQQALASVIRAGDEK
jgi:hypothetical protein